jgi:hypothetical protein
MFPYMSSYLYLLNRNRQRTPGTPWDDVGGGVGGPGSLDTGFGTSSATRPWDVGGAGDGRGNGGGGALRPDRRAGLGSALLAFGANTLEGAGRGDWSGLARGVAAGGEAYAQGQERSQRDAIQAAEERRRQAQDERAAEQERDRNRAADLTYDQGQAEFTAWREQQDRGKALRAQTGKSADQMVAEIHDLAAQNPGDAKLQAMARRASGYALGEDSDLNKLADLHEQMTGQAYRQQDADWETEAKIQGRRRAIEAGVESDPRADDRRADAQLAISRGHLAVAREQSQREGSRITELQRYDRVQRNADTKLRRRVAAYTVAHSDLPPDPATVDQWRQEAVRDAEAEFDSMTAPSATLNAPTAPGSGPSADPKEAAVVAVVGSLPPAVMAQVRRDLANGMPVADVITELQKDLVRRR